MRRLAVFACVWLAVGCAGQQHSKLTLLSVTPASTPAQGSSVAVDVHGVPLDHFWETGRIVLMRKGLDRLVLWEAKRGQAFDSLPPGKYHLKVQMIGYEGAHLDIDIGPGEVRKYRAEMHPVKSNLVELDAASLRQAD